MDIKKIFSANVKLNKSLKSQTKKFYLMSKIHDPVESHHVTCFRNLEAFKEEIKFVFKDDTAIFENNFQKKI